eukprot:NODE_24387_length_627_cov_2.262000.p2 GENE.NODE_24387_length_627_cov_2.262000~~NODE_24387_length_627_cov_2.262000.p2  ORF type:complete len:60 (-),score=10.80 NODE_24387_length_627_cov_2.262000:27-206(-)
MPANEMNRAPRRRRWHRRSATEWPQRQQTSSAELQTSASTVAAGAASEVSFYDSRAIAA